VFLTPSCTAALELAALSLDLDPGDEVNVPSYIFVSTANAFLLRGASLVYVDIEPGTMNIDPVKVREAITSKTRAIIPVHYAGSPCDMDAIFEAMGSRKDIYIVEDAVQGLFSFDKHGRALGSIGNLGCLSFGGTKNLTSGGAGGAIIVNDKKLINCIETIRDKGTNRPQFLKGKVDHYTWQRAGVSHFLSELQAACPWAQLECSEEIQTRRLHIWTLYRQALAPLVGERLQLPPVCLQGQHNAHIFFVKLKDKQECIKFTSIMKDKGIPVLAHYSPLHRSVPGSRGRHVLHPSDFASTESERLIRLPLFYAMTKAQIDHIIENVTHYFT
jgi:dTDP-4-amino-4,6-dideoxygalactose transaminase